MPCVQEICVLIGASHAPHELDGCWWMAVASAMLPDDPAARDSRCAFWPPGSWDLGRGMRHSSARVFALAEPRAVHGDMSAHAVDGRWSHIVHQDGRSICRPSCTCYAEAAACPCTTGPVACWELYVVSTCSPIACGQIAHGTKPSGASADPHDRCKPRLCSQADCAHLSNEWCLPCAMWLGQPSRQAHGT